MAAQEREPRSVEEMQRKLMGLQMEVEAAKDKLRSAEEQLATNLARVNELKAEAVGAVV